MKKQLLLFAIITLSLPGWASTKIGDLYYDLYGWEGTANVTYESLVNDNYKSLSGTLSIPETVLFEGHTYSVTSIGDRAFDGCSGLTSVTIPNSVTSIGDRAFYNCGGLTNVTIPNSVTEIGIHAFSRCSELKSIVVDNGNPALVSIDGILYNKSLNTIICYPAGLTGGFEIPNSVTEIVDGAFEGCRGLTRVTIPNSVISIGRYVFGGCSLTNVTIPNSVTSIGDGAFSPVNVFTDCSELKSIVVDNGNPAFTSIDGILYNKSLDTIICYPAGLTGGFEIPNSVIFIRGEAFRGCTSLTSVKIPDSVTSIGFGTFMGCFDLTSVEIPNSVISIGMFAFDACIGLTSVTIPTSVTEIGDYAFEHCYHLTSVTIPNSVTSIGDRAFYNCSGLTSVYIGEKVRDIGNGAFRYCTKLEEVTVAAPMPPMASEDIFDTIIFDSATLFVPENSMDSYKATTPWSYFNSFKDINESCMVEVGVDVSEIFYDVFNLNGQLVKRQASQSDIDALEPGIYIIGGKKVIVK